MVELAVWCSILNLEWEERGFWLVVAMITLEEASINCELKQRDRHGATRHLQMKQFSKSLKITSFDNQLATSLLTTCNRLVRCRKPCKRILHIGLLITSLLQDVNTLVAACGFLAM